MTIAVNGDGDNSDRKAIAETLTPAGAVVQFLHSALDQALETQFDRAVRAVEGHRRRHPDATPDEVATHVMKLFARDIAVIGAAGGAVAAVPGPGTLAKVTGGTFVETGILLERASHMILGVAHAFGHDLADIEVRRFAVLRVLGAWAGMSAGATGVAGTMGAGLGKQATQAIPMSVIHAANRRIGKQVIFKWATRTGTIRLGSALPFGIGMGLGGASNYWIGRGLGAAARLEFRPVDSR